MMMVVLQIVKYLLMDKVCASAVGVKEYVLLTCSLVGILDGQHVTHTAQSFISSLLITILCLLLSSWVWIGFTIGYWCCHRSKDCSTTQLSIF